MALSSLTQKAQGQTMIGHGLWICYTTKVRWRKLREHTKGKLWPKHKKKYPNNKVKI